MVRFIHTGDWQMGLKAAQAASKAWEVRKVRYETAARIADMAHRVQADFVLLAGDTFEDHNVDETDVARTVEALNRFGPIPVFVLPGNHDPLVPGGVWDRRSWREVGPHVQVLKGNEPVELSGGAVLYPCPLRQKHSSMDPTAGIPVWTEGDKRIRIGVAHGSLQVLPKADNFPIAADRAEACRLDYLALGDWHGFRVFGRAVYCGTPEQTTFDERDAGYVAVVEITGPRQAPHVLQERVGRLHWAVFNCEVRDPSDLKHLAEEIASAGDPGNLLSRVVCEVTREAMPDTVSQLDILRKRLDEEVFLLRWEGRAAPAPLRPEDIPEGIFRRAAEDLAVLLGGDTPSGPAAAFCGRDPAELRSAQQLLQHLVREVQ